MLNSEKENLQTVLQTIAQEEGDNFSYDSIKIEEEAHYNSALYTNLAVKLLTIFGGILASTSLLNFVFTAGIHESDIAMLVTGIVFLIGSEILNRLRNDVLLNTMNVTFNISGYLMFSIGFMQLTDNEVWLMLALVAIAVAFILISEGVVFVFLAVLILCGSLINLLLLYKVPELLQIFVGLAAGIFTYMSLHEARLISWHSRLNLLYRPVRMALAFSFLVALAMLSHQDLIAQKVSYVWISSIMLFVVLLFVLRHVMQDNGVSDTKVQAVVYSCVGLVLLPTVFTPSIAGALLLVLSSFYIGHRVSFWIGLLALTFFIIQYYYDLEFTLLQKSGILMLTGCFFLCSLYLLNRYLRNHAH